VGRRLLTGAAAALSLSITAVATMPATPVGASTAVVIPTGVLQPGGSLFTAERQAGLSLASIEISWSAAETGNGVWDENYFTSVRTKIANASTAGLSPVLALGVQYPPSWVFALDSASRMVDQYGDVWATSPGNGDDVVNGVFSAPIRTAIANYTAKVFAELGTNFAAVRWGGGLPYDEVRYPGCPAGRTNCYWAFDAKAKAASPVPGYVPGSGDPTKAQAFIDFYLNSLRDYVTWGLTTLRQSYPGEIDVLFPSWGVRPGDLTKAVSANLNGTTVRTSEITAGLDWARQLPADAGYGNVVAWCTWLNRLDDFTDVASWSPSHFLSSIAPAGMGAGGENTYGAATNTDLQNTMSNARAYAPRRVLWMGESLTQQVGNATLTQIGQAAGQLNQIVEGETMKSSPAASGGVISDASASQGSAFAQWMNGTASVPFSLPVPSSTITMRLRGTSCKGSPQMVARIDGSQVLASAVSPTTWTDYTVNVATAAGSHTLSIAFTNDFSTRTCDRNLYIDKTTLT